MIKMKKKPTTDTATDRLLDPKAFQEYISQSAKQFNDNYEKAMEEHIKLMNTETIEAEIAHLSALIDNRLYDDCLGDIEIELYKIRVSETQTPSTTKNKRKKK